jgi:diguanylate cyclase (GGDEF)-like protein/PAS domain S-box-containing protein
MDLQLTPQVVPFAGAAIVLALLLHVAWSHRRDPVARWFAATLISLIVWAAGYCFEIMATGLDGKILFANIEFLGVATVSICWWEMVRRYLDFRGFPKVLTGFLWMLAAATMAVAFLNPGGVFRGTPHVITGEAPFPVLHADYGLWYYWVLIPVTGLLNTWTLLALALATIRAKRLYRRQFALLFAALAVPLVANIWYVFDLPPWQDYNLTVAASGLSGLLMGVGLFRWRLFNIIPLAHDRVIENLADGVIVVDQSGCIIDMNPSAQRTTGLSSDDVLGRTAAEALSAHPVIVEALSSVSAAPVGASRQDMVIKNSGISTYFALSASPVTSHRGKALGATVIMHDITEHVRLFEQARELANKDDLTGISNRRHFFELALKEFGRARRYGKPASVVLFDIDHFKAVNDTLGHRAGDRLLRELAQVCRRELRDSDIIGRVGGEEFAVILPETGMDVALEVADRLREAAAAMVMASDRDDSKAQVAITISLGVAELKISRAGVPESLDSVYERADRALYQAKDLGRNTVVGSKEAPSLRAVV